MSVAPSSAVPDDTAHPTASASASGTSTEDLSENLPLASDIIPTRAYQDFVGALRSRRATATPTERIDRAFRLGALHRRQLAQHLPLARSELWNLTASYWVCVTDRPVAVTRVQRQASTSTFGGDRAQWIEFASEKEAAAYCWAFGCEGFAGLTHLI